jgi:hypothetical protein
MFARSSVFPGMLPAAPVHKLVIFASRTWYDRAGVVMSMMRVVVCQHSWRV